MAVVTIVSIPGASATDYAAATGEMGWPDDVPDRPIWQAVGTDTNGLRVVGVWESRKKFDAFVDDWLYPALADVGADLSEEPVVEELALCELWPEK